MAKSKAQRMKEYRERKKEQLGDRWAKQERDRMRAAYIPTSVLSDRETTKRRAKNRKSFQTYYLKNKKTRTENGIAPEPSSSHVSDENIVSSTTEGMCNDRQTITVKFPFEKQGTSERKKKGKRESRTLKRTRQRIETLEDQAEELKRKLKTAQRRLQRYAAKKNPQTPRSKSDSILKKSGIDPKKVPEVRKRLIYGECLSSEIKQSLASNTNMKSQIHRVVSGQIMKKYRLKSYLQNATTLNRRKLINHKEITVTKRRVMLQKANKTKEDVLQFLSRDDNSRMLPGKADAVKTGKSKQQKRVMNDYMHNVFTKFRAETSYAMSLSSFCKLRPKHISLVNFASRSVCLCAKHQNFSYKLKALNNVGVSTNTSPDSFVKIYMYQHSPNEFEKLLQKTPNGNMKYQQWKKVKLHNGKERMKIVDNDVPRHEFIETVKKEFDQFICHVDRVGQQYTSVKRMKDNLPAGHVLIQMDFSENYSCKTVEEIQSAYWNASAVTLHPTIIYFNEASKGLVHKSIVFVSEVLNHNAGMVTAIVEKIVGAAKLYVPDLKYVHFWTDSPSSQYRNKSVFDLVNRFEGKYGCKASWHYFESGHGKSACDGVGGTTKGNADNSVKQEKAVIQDADDFYAWAIQTKSEIEYQMITPNDYEQGITEVEQRKQIIKPVKGTMAIHAIATDTSGRLIKRDKTCACESCFHVDGFVGTSTCGWDNVELTKTDTRVVHNERNETNSTKTTKERDQEVAECNKEDFAGAENSSFYQQVRDLTRKKLKGPRNILEGPRGPADLLLVKCKGPTLKFAGPGPRTSAIFSPCFVVAAYEKKCYIGRVEEVDRDDETVYVKFMVQCGKAVKRFKWPANEDKLWIGSCDIIRTIQCPKATGKGGRMFSVLNDVVNLMDNYHEK